MKELQGTKFVVKQIKTKVEKSIRPLGMNTVSLLKKASEKLHTGPADSMHRAESLYMDGYITYPRTESSSYPASFNHKEVVDQIS